MGVPCSCVLSMGVPHLLHPQEKGGELHSLPADCCYSLAGLRDFRENRRGCTRVCVGVCG